MKKRDSGFAIQCITRYHYTHLILFMVPPALGIAQRVLNGYFYISLIPVQDPKEIELRVKDFSERAGYYYQNWDILYAKWKEKVTAEIEGLKGIQIPHLPEK